jgi:hypothetical protein
MPGCVGQHIQGPVRQEWTGLHFRLPGLLKHHGSGYAEPGPPGKENFYSHKAVLYFRLPLFPLLLGLFPLGARLHTPRYSQGRQPLMQDSFRGSSPRSNQDAGS